jgi:hypothetical protein
LVNVYLKARNGRKNIGTGTECGGVR